MGDDDIEDVTPEYCCREIGECLVVGLVVQEREQLLGHSPGIIGDQDVGVGISNQGHTWGGLPSDYRGSRPRCHCPAMRAWIGLLRVSSVVGERHLFLKGIRGSGRPVCLPGAVPHPQALPFHKCVVTAGYCAPGDAVPERAAVGAVPARRATASVVPIIRD